MKRILTIIALASVPLAMASESPEPQQVASAESAETWKPPADWTTSGSITTAATGGGVLSWEQRTALGLVPSTVSKVLTQLKADGANLGDTNAVSLRVLNMLVDQNAQAFTAAAGKLDLDGLLRYVEQLVVLVIKLTPGLGV